MSDPNIAALTSFTLESVIATTPSSAVGTILVNSAGSGQVLEVYSALFANVDGAVSVDVTLELVKASGTVAAVGYQIPVDAKTTEALITKDWPVVLQEGDWLRRSASVGGDVSYIVSYRKYS